MTFSPWTTARGVLESASTAMWILQDVDFKTRMARSLALRLEHLDDEAIFVRDARRHHPHVRSFVEAIPYVKGRIHHLEEVAARFEIPAKRDRRGRLIGFGSAKPSSTDLAEQGFGEGGTYRLLSAVAHNRTWAASMVSLRPVDTGVSVEQHMTVEAARFLIVSAVDWSARAAWAYFRFNGWDLQKLAAVLEANYDQAALVRQERFWHH